METIRTPHYEIVDYDPLRRFSCREFKLPVFPSPFHQHGEIEVTGIYSSHGLLHVGAEVSEFSKNECYILGTSVPHKFYNNPSDSQGPEWAQSIVLQFDRNCFGDDFFENPELQAAKELFARSNRGIRLKGKTAKKCLKALELLHASSGIMRISLMLELMHHIATAVDFDYLMPIAHQPFSSQSTSRMDIITKYLYENLSHKVTLDDIARLCNMNRSSFSRFFKGATGRSLTSYIHEIKFRETCRLLSQTEKTITEIAFDCGYENLSTFNRCFKSYANMTPKDYRKLHGNTEMHLQV